MREQLSVARNDQLCLRGGHRAAAMDHRALAPHAAGDPSRDRKSTRLNSSHSQISYAVFCLKKKKEVDLVPPQTQNQRYSHSHIGATEKDISNVVPHADSAVAYLFNETAQAVGEHCNHLSQG